MTDAERKVRAVWNRGSDVFDNHMLCLCSGYPNCDGDLVGENHEANCPAYIAPDSYWSAALAFTEERLEEIRQLREEIALIDGVQQKYDYALAEGIREEYIQRDDVRKLAGWSRILSRLESLLAEKTAGMKDTSPVRSTT